MKKIFLLLSFTLITYQASAMNTSPDDLLLHSSSYESGATSHGDSPTLSTLEIIGQEIIEKNNKLNKLCHSLEIETVRLNLAISAQKTNSAKLQANPDKRDETRRGLIIQHGVIMDLNDAIEAVKDELKALAIKRKELLNNDFDFDAEVSQAFGYDEKDDASDDDASDNEENFF